jgi:hypothetical protein
MLCATIQRVHVPELCQCHAHLKTFDRAEFKLDTAHTYKDIVDRVIGWTAQQGLNPCWLYTIIKVETI